jgi:hypothetical protein
MGVVQIGIRLSVLLRNSGVTGPLERAQKLVEFHACRNDAASTVAVVGAM